MSNSSSTTRGPLAGVRVLELGSMYAAPTAGRMLRDFGADVVKVEDPSVGDYARQWQPSAAGTAIGFARLNSGKRSVGIDLRDERGRDLVRALATQVDVLIENFRPGRMEKWGMSYDELAAGNSGLVMARVSGFGQTGPYRERPGFGTVAETVSGFAFLNGWPETPPTSPPFGFADSIAGISAAFGITMGLYQRSVTGRGCEVDIALYEPLMFILGDAIINYTATGDVMQRHGNASGAASPRGIYQTSDGQWLAIAASNQAIALRLFDAMGRSDLRDDERYNTNAARMANNEGMQAIVTEWLSRHTRDEALHILNTHEVVAAPVNDSADITRDPHFLERTLVKLTGSRLGSALTPGPVLHLNDYPGPSYSGVPDIGQHTREVLEAAGVERARLDELADAGVISPLVL